ncbi:MAG TPA: nickel pincer cofactor biosynthesis protein LarC [Pyrinomonadaceae bacterium]|nr:nickel pincer cofactor biosynthesis protein LarC [Pyrinomonadaceae bacterium]
MRTLYFDCFAGASGNMILGALIAAGVDSDDLKAELQKMDIPDFELELEIVDRSGIASTHVTVRVPKEREHRHLSDIEKIISGSALSETVKTRSTAIFRRLAEAEGKVHGITVEKVHFHEVGGMDAIIDVVGSCIGFEMLRIENFACSKIHLGSGFVEMSHGKFPVPPPAVAELLRGVPVYSTEVEGELITPTGAAIISTLCDSYGSIPEMLVEDTAYGAGTRTYEKFPNALRVLIGEMAGELTSTVSEQLILLQTNIDDASPQILGFVMERAFELGANDCWFTPIQMKKNRPATMLSVLCSEEKKHQITELIYRETTSLGVREQRLLRDALARQVIQVSTEYGSIDVKIGMLDGKIVNAMPEYDQVQEAAREHGVPFSKVRDAALAIVNVSRFAATK